MLGQTTKAIMFCNLAAAWSTGSPWSFAPTRELAGKIEVMRAIRDYFYLSVGCQGSCLC